MSQLKKRLNAIENSKYLQAVRWVEQNPELFMQFVDMLAALEKLDRDPLQVMRRIMAKAEAEPHQPVMTHEERRRRIRELLDTARQRRDEAMGEGGV